MRTLTAALFDSMGHGLKASRLSALAVATFRNARRRGLPLDEQAREIHRTLRSGFDAEGYTTGSSSGSISPTRCVPPW